MRVLVCAASKCGATEEIAAAIAEELRAHGAEAVLEAPEHVESVDGYDAAVLGSAVYAGHWLDEAKRLVERHADAWRDRAVWQFSSGPIGDPPKPQEEPVDVAAILETTGAREHRVFAGKLDRSNLNFFEKAITVALRAPEGDFRDWEEVRGWAREIAEVLARHSEARAQ